MTAGITTSQSESLPQSRQAPKHNLPVQLTSFIGRSGEVATACALPSRPGARLLTLSGPGGVGKTRLALQISSALLDDFEDGVFFVSFAPIVDPGLVVPTIAQTLGIKDATGKSIDESLQGFLRDKRLLLVLDNFEQVVDAAMQVNDLLASCPQLKVLVTSRKVLQLQGEQEYVVPPLSLPDPHMVADPLALSAYEAVTLFVQRSQSVDPSFALGSSNAQAVAEICVRLDGLPLAIELTAARVRLLPPHALVTRLSNSLQLLTGGARDLAARQQTLRSTIDWSYQLLDAGQQQLFRRMSVFLGGRALEALEAVCNYDGQLQVDVFEGVSALLSHSLVRQREGANGEPRFFMLGTIHEYAVEKLEENKEASILRRQHALYFMALAEEAEPHLTTVTQREWLDRLEEEHDNLRAAITWARETGTTGSLEVGLRIGGAIWRLWHTRGYLGEGKEQLVKLLSSAQHLEQTGDAWAGDPHTGRVAVRIKAKALNGAGLLAMMHGDLVGARLLEEALVVARESEDERTIAYSLNNLASVYLSRGSYEMARALHEESMAISRRVGDARALGISLNGLGHIALSEADYRGARTLYEESLVLVRGLGDKVSLALALNALGFVLFFQGEHQSARDLFEECLAISRELRDKSGISWSQYSLGYLAYIAGDYQTARSLLAESLTIRRELGDKSSIAWSLDGLGHVALAERNQALARPYYQESAAIRREIDEKWGIAHSLLSLGSLALVEGDYQAARSLYEQGLAAHQEIGNKSGIAWSLGNLGNVAYAEGDYVAASTLYRDSLLIRQEIGETRAIIAALAGIGASLTDLGQPQAGARLLGCVDAQLAAIGAALEPADRIPYERGMMSARSHLGEGLRTALETGGAMDIAAAIEYAFEHTESLGTRERVSRQSYPYDLTRREVELLNLLVEGLTNEQMAERLFLSTNTVRSHLHSIYSKINVGNRGAAARFAMENNLISVG